MKVFNDLVVELNANLRNELNNLRNKRKFDAKDWINKKTKLINSYFRESSIPSAILGVSGGIDSSVVLALIHRASQSPDSPIRSIHPMILPAYSNSGVTRQSDASFNAQLICGHLRINPVVFDGLSEIANAVTEELETKLDYVSDDWARGQLIPYLRTPILYNTCSILTANGQKAIVVGTTNLSEGGYLGYVGKASDGMTDLQIISDLYKSEVEEVAKLLEIPSKIIHQTPTGDMFDGRSDVEVFGASYDFVELFHLAKQFEIHETLLRDSLYVKGARNLEKLHQYNSHKYLYHYPSVFLDIMPSKIPGGWENNPWTPRKVK